MEQVNKKGTSVMQGTFKTDLSVGEQFELDVKDYLNGIDNGCKYAKIDGYFTGYDLICNHCNRTIECKHDKKSVYTGNFVFERSLFDKSTARYVAYKHWWYNEILEVATESGMFYLFDRAGFIIQATLYMKRRHKKFILGGDYIRGVQNEMLIVPIKDLPLWFNGTYKIIDTKFNKRGI